MIGLGSLAKKIFGTPNDRKLKAYPSRVAAVNALEAEVAALSDEALQVLVAVRDGRAVRVRQQRHPRLARADGCQPPRCP